MIGINCHTHTEKTNVYFDFILFDSAVLFNCTLKV